MAQHIFCIVVFCLTLTVLFTLIFLPFQPSILIPSIVPHMIGYLDLPILKGPRIEHNTSVEICLMLCSVVDYNFIIGFYWTGGSQLKPLAVFQYGVVQSGLGLSCYWYCPLYHFLLMQLIKRSFEACVLTVPNSRHSEQYLNFLLSPFLLSFLIILSVPRLVQLEKKFFSSLCLPYLDLVISRNCITLYIFISNIWF